MSALTLLVLGLLTEVAPVSCQQGSTGQGYLGCREERAGRKTVTEVGWGGVLEGKYTLGHSPPTGSVIDSFCDCFPLGRGGTAGNVLALGFRGGTGIEIQTSQQELSQRQLSPGARNRGWDWSQYTLKGLLWMGAEGW